MIDTGLAIPKRKPRRYIQEDFKLEQWEQLEPILQELVSREINSVTELENWLYDSSELGAILREDLSWRFIKTTIDTTDQEVQQAYKYFVTEIQPKAAPYFNNLDKKLVASPYTDQLDQNIFGIYLKKTRTRIKLYREENIPLFAEMSVKEKEYSSITGSMTINYDDKELTMQQAAVYLKNPDRNIREEVYILMQERRQQDVDVLNKLFDELLDLRHRIALNAGFDNYRDYKFVELNRFDYGVEECEQFHNSIRNEILPIEDEILKARRSKLGVDELKPWDLAVDPTGKAPLKPFMAGKELVDGVKDIFYRMHPYFGERLDIMQMMEHLDVESRKGKAPGGYNSTLSEIGVPFIFMNASGSSRDVRVMIHEGGHAIHSFLMRNLEFFPNRNIPSEVAELASMSMELMTLEYWDIFYNNPEDLKRAKIEQLEGVFNVLPWVAIIDKFQHWLYTHPGHTTEERTAMWNNILDQFSSSITNWEGVEEYRDYLWQKQLHLYQVPFYYIEYAMAQLGALAMWRQYTTNPQQAIENYINALSLGYTRSIGELYEAAGIKFNFSNAYVSELADFIKEKLREIQQS